jgi:hypothetical protein
MRDATRTVLSMQNNYQGPPENFALVVPVPVVLKKENVKTLPNEVFARVDKMTAPRLVEYWEQDPCAPRYFERAMGTGRRILMSADSGRIDLGVKVEARFTVGEYEIVILSAKQATGLDTWLRQNNYKIPAGAAPVLRPYVQGGSKFFVAKVDPKKVRFENGQAMLSPLRFHYDSKEFSLPVRLGLLNSSGTQDLIVHVLARGQRYEVANYPNVTIPTNLDLATAAKDRFGPFYVALFDALLKKNPGAVVTEYAWDASSCDPCPEPALQPEELLTLGADVLVTAPQPPPVPGLKGRRPPAPPAPPIGQAGGFVLTRLHARYSKQTLGQDLVFRAAPPIAGGREFPQASGGLERGAVPSSVNNFQGRYAIRHPWTGAITCDKPIRGTWGGPPGATPALGLAFVPRDRVELGALLKQDLDELGVKAVAGAVDKPSAAPPTPVPPAPPTPPQTPAPPAEPPGGACGSCGVGSPRGASSEALWLLLAAAAWGARRPERR